MHPGFSPSGGENRLPVRSLGEGGNPTTTCNQLLSLSEIPSRNFKGMTQSEALTILKTGANVFLTGEPGSGKTHAVNEYVSYLRSCGIEPAITASTGIAATHLNGMTIHSWSGIGVKRTLDEYDLDFIAANEKRVRRIRNARVLIIDEISMLSAQALNMVDVVLRTLRHSNDVFGGLQMVLVGDFFQLPPVVGNRSFGSTERLPFANVGGDPSRQFAFASMAWEKLKPVACYLSEQYRQEDQVFLGLLSSLRSGRVTSEHRALLLTRFLVNGEADAKAGMTKLFSHNADVDRINETELAKLPTHPRNFPMVSRGQKPLIEQLKRGCLSPELLKLKTGARVMFTKNNFEEGFVNGTTGEVIGFRSSDGYPVVRTKSGDITVEPESWAIEADRKALAEITQLPLRLAWAITVHKSQGMSLDAAVIDLGDAFEYGQGYVALSRLRTLAGMHLLGLNKRALEVHPAIVEKDQSFRSDSDEAQRVFGELPRHELSSMHENFVRACGGSLAKSVTSERIRTPRPRRAKLGLSEGL
jgi:hypothetical protein